MKAGGGWEPEGNANIEEEEEEEEEEEAATTGKPVLAFADKYLDIFTRGHTVMYKCTPGILESVFVC